MFRSLCHSHPRHRCLSLGLIAALGFAALATRAAAQAEPPARDIAGMTVYVGMAPSEIVRGHKPSHTEAQMHGGARQGGHELHLIVAIFEQSSGKRIEDAQVAATLSGVGHVAPWKVKLEPMLIAGTVTYGAFVNLPGPDRYALAIDIVRGSAAPVRVEFTYRHGR